MLIGYGVLKTYGANTSYACSDDKTGGGCIIFNISCGLNEKIQILEATYGDSSPRSCLGRNPIWKCGPNENCCAARNDDSRRLYTLNNRYLLHTQCSWKDKCSARAAINFQNDYSAVSYDCIREENTARFCKASITSKDKISVVFENTTEFYNEDLAVCKCFINSTRNFTLKALDLRLQNATGDCTDNNEVMLKDKKINCLQRYEVQNASHLTNEFKEMTLILTLDPANKPQMILIEVQGDSGSSITVQCVDPYQIVPTTTEISSSTPGNHSTASSLTAPVNTAPAFSITPSVNSSLNSMSTLMTIAPSENEPTGAPSTSTGTTATKSTKSNQTSSRDSTVLNIHTKDSDGVPVAGIVVPLIVFFLAGVGFVVILWRKRCMRNPETKFSSQDNRRKTAVDNAIHNAAYFNEPLKTSDNYMILEPANEYTYFDNGDDTSSKTVRNHDNGHTKIAQVNTGYTGEELVNGSSSERFCNNCATEGREPNILTRNINKKYESAVHHSQNSYNKIINQNADTNSDNYFVLEPQKFTLNAAECPGSKRLHNLDVNDKKEIQCPEYLELEPHDTYTSIDPDDGNLQSSANDEYNMINLKGKIIIRDPNYGALNFGMNAKKKKRQLRIFTFSNHA